MGAEFSLFEKGRLEEYAHVLSAQDQRVQVDEIGWRSVLW
jgi:hypothetical protein